MSKKPLLAVIVAAVKQKVFQMTTPSVHKTKKGETISSTRLPRTVYDFDCTAVSEGKIAGGLDREDYSQTRDTDS
jgi:hypothetical protein